MYFFLSRWLFSSCLGGFVIVLFSFIPFLFFLMVVFLLCSAYSSLLCFTFFSILIVGSIVVLVWGYMFHLVSFIRLIFFVLFVVIFSPAMVVSFLFFSFLFSPPSDSPSSPPESSSSSSFVLIVYLVAVHVYFLYLRILFVDPSLLGVQGVYAPIWLLFLTILFRVQCLYLNCVLYLDSYRMFLCGFFLLYLLLLGLGAVLSLREICLCLGLFLSYVV